MSVRTYENRETKRRNSDVKMRIEALHEALDAGRTWLDPDTVSRAENQLSIARGRLRHSLDHTVVAISGPTGAGKSSLVNALAGKDLARVSVRRPTTSQGLAVVWDSTQQGRAHAASLLDWLGVNDRHYLSEVGEPVSEKPKRSFLARPRAHSATENIGASRPISSASNSAELPRSADSIGKDRSSGAPSSSTVGQAAPWTHGTPTSGSRESVSGPAAAQRPLSGFTASGAGGSSHSAPNHANASLATNNAAGTPTTNSSQSGAPQPSPTHGQTLKKKPELHSGLIVVDLPDFDSVVAEHRVRADHLTERADLLVWVTDPQKYADAIFHHEYLSRFKNHSEMLVVLNQADRLTPKEKEQCLADIRRLLVEDGITGATVMAVSTVTGEGISQLHSLLEIAVARRAAQANSLIAELRECGRLIAEECGQVPSRNESAAPKERLVESLAQASGVYAITEAVYDSSLRRSHIATGWPVTAWIAKVRKDPLRSLGLTAKWSPRSQSGKTPTAPDQEVHPSTVRSSVPVSDQALSAKAHMAVRDYVDAATIGGPTPWVLGVRKSMGSVDLADDLDSAITNSPSIRLSQPGWWKAISWLHKVFLLMFVVGMVWLGLLALSAYLRMDVPNTPTWMGYPIPTLLTLGGVMAGIVLGLVCRVFSIVHAQRQSKRVFGALRAEIEDVAFRRVVKPVRDARDQRESCVLAALVACR